MRITYRYQQWERNIKLTRTDIVKKSQETILED